MFNKIFAKLFTKTKIEQKSKGEPLPQDQDVIDLNIELKTEVIANPQKITSPLISENEIIFERQLIKRIENALSEYDFVKKEKIAFLAEELIKDRLKHSKNLLSLDEKRSLNLNTRSKYAREFIECFINVEDFDFDPKFFCRNLKNTEQSILWCLNNIEELKQKGFVKRVELEGKGLWNNKTYDIDKIPPMEKIDYTEEQVLFFVIAKVDY
ncbi:hypothetical protein BKK47_07555 [Rodentibacter mrazii]|uniref:Uncharacterized protein n=1 Tax=Rodentibacter mrazii TaxID=1908257 RepID=A0A1V3IF71_9PAST|nr:hypothetical protein [Rodentibacter mrazii]OOF39065.1 hypothetical protein BKK47_07555 [Rodentibacter mrazii]